MEGTRRLEKDAKAVISLKDLSNFLYPFTFLRSFEIFLTNSEIELDLS